MHYSVKLRKYYTTVFVISLESCADWELQISQLTLACVLSKAMKKDDLVPFYGRVINKFRANIETNLTARKKKLFYLSIESIYIL